MQCIPRLAALGLGVASLLTPAIAGAAVDVPADERTAPHEERAAPQWEWGLGVAAAWLRDYPGSRHYGAYGLPFPWITWRSERVMVGREGGRGVLWRGT